MTKALRPKRQAAAGARKKRSGRVHWFEFGLDLGAAVRCGVDEVALSSDVGDVRLFISGFLDVSLAGLNFGVGQCSM